MPRASSVTKKARHKKVLKLAKGYRGSNSKLYRTAKQQVMRALRFQFRDRKQKKRNFRKLWITRINAACRINGISYSQFINGLKKSGVEINRKMLAYLAVNDEKAFAEIVKEAKKGLKKDPNENVKKVLPELVVPTVGVKSLKSKKQAKKETPKMETKTPAIKEEPKKEQVKKEPKVKITTAKKITTKIEEKPKKEETPKGVIKAKKGEVKIVKSDKPKKIKTKAEPKAPIKTKAEPVKLQKKVKPKEKTIKKRGATESFTKEELSKKTVAELKALAKSLSLQKYSTLKKAELVDYIYKNLY